MTHHYDSEFLIEHYVKTKDPAPEIVPKYFVHEYKISGLGKMVSEEFGSDLMEIVRKELKRQKK